jgi:hypothetical protein
VIRQGAGTQFDPEIARVFDGLGLESLSWIRDLFPERNERQDTDLEASAIGAGRVP